MVIIQDLDIKHIFNKVVNHSQPIYQLKSKFINIIKKQSKYTTSLSRDEINWMVQNLDAIENIVNSKKAVAIFWCLFKNKESYTAQIARQVRSYTSPVKYWLRSFKSIWLVEERSSAFRRDKVFYHLNRAIYPNLIGTFITLMKERYGEPELNAMTTPDRSGGLIVDKQYNSIKHIKNKGSVKSSVFN